MEGYVGPFSATAIEIKAYVTPVASVACHKFIFILLLFFIYMNLCQSSCIRMLTNLISINYNPISACVGIVTLGLMYIYVEWA